MKHDLITKAMAVMFLMAFVVTACNKDDDPPDPGELQSLSFDTEEVMALVPEGLKNSNDEYAEQCVGFIESVAEMSSIIDDMDVPEGATRSSSKASGDYWQWTSNIGGQSYTFYWSYEENNSRRNWSMDIQFGSGPRYNYIDAWETNDGMQGELTFNFQWAYIYDGDEWEDDDFLYWRYTWAQTSAGGYNLSYVIDGDSEVEESLRYDCVINANGSGTIDYYMMEQLFYHMDWDVIGNGNWVYYMDGEMFMEGSWSVV